MLENLVEVEAPNLGDIITYGRPKARDAGGGYGVEWPVAIYLGSGSTIAACDLAGRVCVGPMEYDADAGERRWQLLDAAPYRMLEFR